VVYACTGGACALETGRRFVTERGKKKKKKTEPKFKPRPHCLGKNRKSRVICLNANWTGNLMGFLFEDRESREGKDLTGTVGMKNKFWHLSLGRIKLPTSPHYCLLLQQARKVVQMSLFFEQTLENKQLMLAKISVYTCVSCFVFSTEN